MNSEQGLQRLAECRREIDRIDLEILALINQRTTVVQEIGRVKEQLALPIYEPRREDEVFRNVAQNNRGPLTDDALKRVFERIIDEMRQVQRQRMLDQRQQS
jgi:chorismate mutase